MKVICQYCSKPAIFTDSKVVYGRSYGMIYLCEPCGAYVGVHKGTKTPLGILANEELRLYKKKTHAYFDPLWRSGQMTRKRAYKWLAKQMAKPIKECHIGMFGVEECKKAIDLILNYRKENNFN